MEDTQVSYPHPPPPPPPKISRPGDPPTLGDRPAEDAVRRLGLTSFAEPEDGARQTAGEGASNPFSALLPWLTSISASTDKMDSSVTKATRYLVATGLPTLTMRVVERIWSLEFVEMEDLLPAPRSLRLAKQGASPKSLQDSLVGALSHFQALQQHKAQHRVTDITTWVKCFSLYMAVLAKKEPTMVPSMVAHLHAVLRLHQRALQHFAWLEYDIQFRMELAASENKGWKEGDPWQYVACLPGQRQIGDPFDTPEVEVPTSKEKGKRPMELEGEKNLMQNPKRPNKAVCRLFNLAPRGCPYGRECIFVHRCTNCGAVDDHGRLACPTLQGPSTGPKPDGGLQKEFHSPSPRR